MHYPTYKIIPKLFQQETEPPNAGLSFVDELPLSSLYVLHPYIVRKMTSRCSLNSRNTTSRVFFPNLIFLYPSSVPCFIWKQSKAIILECISFFWKIIWYVKHCPWPATWFKSLLIGGETSNTIGSHDDKWSSQRSPRHFALNIFLHYDATFKNVINLLKVLPIKPPMASFGWKHFKIHMHNTKRAMHLWSRNTKILWGWPT